MPRTRQYQNNGERQAAYRRGRAQATPAAIPSAPGRSRWKALIKAASVLLNCAGNEMQDYSDQRSEAWQDSQPGESLAEMLESLQKAAAILEDITPKSKQTKPVIT